MSDETSLSKVRWLSLEHILMLIIWDMLPCFWIINSIDAHRVFQCWVSCIFSWRNRLFKICSVLSSISTIATHISLRSLHVSWRLTLAMFEIHSICYLFWLFVFIIPETSVNCFLIFSFKIGTPPGDKLFYIVVDSFAWFNSLMIFSMLVKSVFAFKECLNSLFVLFILIQSCKVGEARYRIVHCIAATFCL